MRPDTGPGPLRRSPSVVPMSGRSCGSSSRASGLPRASARMRSRTWASIGPPTDTLSRPRASVSWRPSTVSSGRPASSSRPRRSRVANTGPGVRRASAAPRDARVCAETRSSHCVSSTRQNNGCSAATSVSSPSTAMPTRNRSGGGPSLIPNAVARASRCGGGRRSRRSRNGAHSWCSPANGSSISDSAPAPRATRCRETRASRWSSRADFPIPASPRRTSAALRPASTSAARASRTCRSRRRPRSCLGPSPLLTLPPARKGA